MGTAPPKVLGAAREGEPCEVSGMAMTPALHADDSFVTRVGERERGMLLSAAAAKAVAGRDYTVAAGAPLSTPISARTARTAARRPSISAAPMRPMRKLSATVTLPG